MDPRERALTVGPGAPARKLEIERRYSGDLPSRVRARLAAPAASSRRLYPRRSAVSGVEAVATQRRLAISRPALQALYQQLGPDGRVLGMSGRS